MQRAHPREQQAVFGHCVVDARARQDDAAHRAERRHDHEQRNRGCGASARHRGRGVERDVGGGEHAVERQHEQIGSIERKVRHHHHHGPEHQRARDDTLGIASLLGRVGHHVPAAEREQPGDERAEKRARLDGRCGRRRVQRADPEQDREQHGDRGELRDRQCRLHGGAGPHSSVIDRREAENAADGRQANAEIAHRRDRRDVARKHHRDRRDDSRVHAPEHRPAPEEPGGGREDLAKKDVDATGSRKRGRQLRADAGAEPRERTRDDPHEQHAAECRNRAAHLRWLHEDRRADNRPDDHRGGLRQPDSTSELRRHRSDAKTAKPAKTAASYHRTGGG